MKRLGVAWRLRARKIGGERSDGRYVNDPATVILVGHAVGEMLFRFLAADPDKNG